MIVTSFCHIAKAGNNKFTFNIRTYTTNVYVGVGLLAVYGSIIKDDEDPLGSLFSMSPYMFAIPIHNTGNDEIGDLKSPYRRCLKAPWKDLGDYKVGLNLSYDNVTTPFGFYIGCDYKSVEVPTNKIDHRTHYISPNAGLRLRYGETEGLLLEIGGAYDIPFKYSGMFNNDINVVNSGVTLNFGIGGWQKSGTSVILQYEHPIYNYFNEKFSLDGGASFPLMGVKRTMGYISLAFRYGF